MTTHVSGRSMTACLTMLALTAAVLDVGSDELVRFDDSDVALPGCNW